MAEKTCSLTRILFGMLHLDVENELAHDTLRAALR
jgi:hypothetical protein